MCFLRHLFFFFKYKTVNTVHENINLYMWMKRKFMSQYLAFCFITIKAIIRDISLVVWQCLNLSMRPKENCGTKALAFTKFSLFTENRMFQFLAYWPIGHKLLAWPCVVIGGGSRRRRQQFFSSLFFSETTVPNTSKLYIQLPYIGVYKNSSLHVDPIVDVDFIGLWNF